MEIPNKLINHWALLCDGFERTIEHGRQNHLNETADETVRRLGILSEMAIPLSEYQGNAEDLRFQIVENWCLCKHCQLYNPSCANFNHWKIELRAFIKKLKFIEIKNGVDKKKTLNRAWISRCDLNKQSMVFNIIKDKFDGEGIKDDVQMKAVALAFANNVEGLIECISNNGITPDSYIQNTFGNSAPSLDKPTSRTSQGKPSAT